jgi:hypothetical protein
MSVGASCSAVPAVAVLLILRHVGSNSIEILLKKYVKQLSDVAVTRFSSF